MGAVDAGESLEAASDVALTRSACMALDKYACPSTTAGGISPTGKIVAIFCASSFEEVAVVEVSRRSKGDGKEATSRSKPSSGRLGMPSARRVRTMSSRSLSVELTSVSRQNSARPSMLLCIRTRSDAYCALSCTADGCSRSSAVN